MKTGSPTRIGRSEKGIALLISIFILLLISVVAIALIVSSGTESALAGNYRSSTGVYYAALSGLEEARGRLEAKNPSAFKTTNPTGFLPPPGTPLNIGDAYYVINPVGGETIAPWDPSSTYPDIEFMSEFTSSGFAAPPNPSPSALSAWNNTPLNALGVPGPLYKWVRINAVSEKSLNLDVYAYDGIYDQTTPVFYDGTRLNIQNSGAQVLEITALAVLPNGSQKLLQYLTAPVPITLPPFLAALTLSGSAGNDPVFKAPEDNHVYAVQGDDQDCSGNLTGSKFEAIGLFGDYSGGSYNPAVTGVIGGIPLVDQPKYTGLNSAPDVKYLVTFPANLQTPSQLDAIMQSIAQNADVTIPPGPITYPLPTVTGSALTPLGMTSSNLLTVVVNGNLDISSWGGTGYGLLVVTGKFTYDPDSTWDGIILVVGQGTVGGSHNQWEQINGAMFVAKTRNASGVLMSDPNLGGASVVFDEHMQGNGIRYSSCWIQKAQPTSGYKILSFHEISQ